MTSRRHCQKPAIIGGLGPTARWAPASGFSGGKVTVTDGPFTEAKEVVGGYAQFELKSKERQSNRRSASWNFTRNIGQARKGETELRQMFGPKTSLARHRSAYE